ncbi:cell death-inducing p53-target protein 1 [Folsomia candida]|uniref:LITAF domain-containing protein n=1 Tax=Folsomia candida TaxID=158441 RepID=A0A226DFM6_FOLCA|nr:cell death-inducing p53-target protein 1 [Folsomia candida]XP_035714964.1 cell death-inducing p53-target protein 1 [Folsomia candida]OXA43006.1 hypothetical protein Fcan01_22088 [Folsomia candida]
MADPRYPVLEIYDPPPPYPYLDGQQPVVHSSAATAPPYEAASTGNDDGPLAKKDVATSNQIHVSVSSVQVPVATRVVILPGISDHNPQRTVCPHCRADMLTRTRRVTGSCQHCWALCLCCFVGCPFCLIPYCCDNECGDTVHSCENCQMDVATVHRM